MTDTDRLFLLCVLAAFFVVGATIAELVSRRQHNAERKRAGRSLLDPRDHRPSQIAIDYKHLDARRAWRSIVEQSQ